MDTQLVALLEARLAAREASVEALVVEGPEGAVGRRGLLAPDGSALAGDLPAELVALLRDPVASMGPGARPRSLRVGPAEAGWRVYLERWGPPPRLVVFGGGHVGRAICAAVRDLEVSVLVIEDRDYFADPRRFEGSVETLKVDLPQGAEAAGVGPGDLVVIATRGHVEDLACLRSALRAGPRYLGLLGSRRKLREFRKALIDEGLEAASIDAVRCPVGLDIGAETPAEIAVSVAAEVVKVLAES